MTDQPISIRCFETVQIVAVILGLMNGFAVGLNDFMNAVVAPVVVLTLTFLISRRRKSWPRWVFLGLLLLGLAFTAWNAPALFAFGHLVTAVALGVNLMNSLAVILLFTPDSTKWFRTAPAAA